MANPANHGRKDIVQGVHAGRLVGRYRLITEVAKGGMASVYLALDTEDDAQLAAVKIIHPELASDEELVRMFFDEACIASQVHHPNTARVLAYGSEGRLHYLAMNYLLGETWQQVLHRAVRQEGGEGLPPLLAHVLREVALGLHAAHEAVDRGGRPLHVVHRDVSPQNVMVGYDGQVHVLDFGIAKIGNRVDPREQDPVQGRFAYMAPEQMRGSEVDRRADLWSLGVLLWEGLTHRRLFRRHNDHATIMAAAYAEIPRADQIRPDAPRVLSDIAEALLQRERNERPSDADVVARMLSRYLELEGLIVGPEPVRCDMRRLFGTRGEEKRRTIERLRRRFSRSISVGVLLPEALPILEALAPTAEKRSGLRPAPREPVISGVRTKRTAPVAARPMTFSEAPTSPRMPAPAATQSAPTALAGPLRWLALTLAAATAAGTYLWLSG